KKRLLPILRDIASGIRFLHAATPQIVHCDLKASNILVDGRFRAKVADFGLSTIDTDKTGAAGTPYFLAPEILRGETGNTAESDAYAFGMVIFEMYSRKDPYDGENPLEVLCAVANKAVNKRPPLPPTCPPKAQTLMMECLVGDPRRRPTFEELDCS
ncbi:activated protein kinase catalytic subunit alpha-1 (Partial), partial [Seminavis robusta]